MRFAASAFESANTIVATVARLFFFCCPAAIVGLVIAAIVYPIKSVPDARSLSHVFKEVFENKPATANLNSPTTVSMINGENVL